MLKVDQFEFKPCDVKTLEVEINGNLQTLQNWRTACLIVATFDELIPGDFVPSLASYVVAHLHVVFNDRSVGVYTTLSGAVGIRVVCHTAQGMWFVYTAEALATGAPIETDEPSSI